MAGQAGEDQDFMSGLLGGIEALVAEPIWNLFDRGRQGPAPPEPLHRQRSSSAEGRCSLLSLAELESRGLVAAQTCLAAC